MADNNRVSYFVPTKKPNMFVGPVGPDQLDTLINVITAAKKENKSIVFFLWKNEPREGSKSVAALTVAVAEPRPQAGVGGGFRSRPIGSSPKPSAPASDPFKGLFGG